MRDFAIINILGQRWEVHVKALPSGTHGECRPDERTIILAEDSDQKESTLVHEILHATLARTGWAEALAESNISEEALVCVLETGIVESGIVRTDFRERHVFEENE